MTPMDEGDERYEDDDEYRDHANRSTTYACGCVSNDDDGWPP